MYLLTHHLRHVSFVTTVSCRDLADTRDIGTVPTPENPFANPLFAMLVLPTTGLQWHPLCNTPWLGSFLLALNKSRCGSPSFAFPRGLGGILQPICDLEETGRGSVRCDRCAIDYILPARTGASGLQPQRLELRTAAESQPSEDLFHLWIVSVPGLAATRMMLTTA
jgi:hypothetical protein